MFGSAASAFFAAGSVGDSPAADPERLNGLELRCCGWRVEPLDVAVVRLSFFDDRSRFPPGPVAFDCALLMRGSSASGTACRTCAAGRMRGVPSTW
ncbi:MAG TPA: hypothetical protein VM597_22155 [Gemmataceae bacterium]|nr:hypothetical protein [Gemmataceae bacterium]